jgi:hypothetical protein
MVYRSEESIIFENKTERFKISINVKCLIYENTKTTFQRNRKVSGICNQAR